MGVLEDAFREATKSLNLKDRRDRFRAAYVTRRAAKLHQQKPSSDGLDLAVHIMREQAEIMPYITRKVEQLIKGPDPKEPHHLDLAVMANFGGLSVSVKILEKTYVTNRSEWTGTAVNRFHGLPNSFRAELPAEA